MTLDTQSFVHDFRPGAIHYGRGCVSDLDAALADRGLERALVVTGTNVGANNGVMDPVEAGLGDRLAGVFAETSPAKRIETAYDGVERMRELDVDALVAVGAGSSLDTATVMSVLHGSYRSLDEIQSEVAETADIALPDDPGDLTPLIPVPTTFAGADLSVAAGTVIPMGDGDHTEVILVGEELMPEAFFYDPDLFDTTPMGVLAGSAINGFDKAVEAIYSEFSNPITDSTAVRSLKYLRSSLPELREADDPGVMERAVMGIVLAQYGVSIPDAYKINVIHAFGHGLRNQWGIQQGVAHAVMVPHVLELIFEQVDGRRDLLAEGLVQGPTPDDPASAVIEAVGAVRDGLGLPARLREVEGTDEAGIRGAAELTHRDDFVRLGPDGFDPSIDAIEAAIRAAW